MLQKSYITQIKSNIFNFCGVSPHGIIIIITHRFLKKTKMTTTTNQFHQHVFPQPQVIFVVAITLFNLSCVENMNPRGIRIF